jgi:predicted ATP-dependent protease
VRKLNEEAVLFAVGHLIDDLLSNYAAYPAVCDYLNEVQQNVIESIDEFRHPKEGMSAFAALTSELPNFGRFLVNLLVGREDDGGAPVIHEDHPTYQNLMGRVEHISQLGALVTNFLLIKPGALHLANGGYLLLDAFKLLSQPFSWEGLKRALSTREVRIESLGQMYSLVSTVSLEPEPIPLDVKVILFGNRMLYFLLAQYDPEFGELFKVAADFEDEVERSADNDLLYARLIGTLARREKLRPFERDAVARVIEHSARRAEDAQKLSTHMESLADLMREADYQAAQDKREAVARATSSAPSRRRSGAPTACASARTKPSCAASCTSTPPASRSGRSTACRCSSSATSPSPSLRASPPAPASARASWSTSSARSSSAARSTPRGC